MKFPTTGVARIDDPESLGRATEPRLSTFGNVFGVIENPHFNPNEVQ